MMGTIKYILAAAAVVALLLFMIKSEQEEKPALRPVQPQYKTAVISLGDSPLSVRLADTPEKQTVGLSDTEKLRENEGMLFIFPQPLMPDFWMKDMDFSIDMIWIDANKKIIKIDSSISPATYPKKFSPSSPVIYVLEVNAGWAERHDIRVGDTLNF